MTACPACGTHVAAGAACPGCGAPAAGASPPGRPDDGPAPPPGAGPAWAVTPDAVPPSPYPAWAVDEGTDRVVPDTRRPITTTGHRSAPPPPGRRSPGLPARSLLLAGLAAAVVAVGLVAITRRDGGTGDGPVSPDAIGACFRYRTDGPDRRVDRVVPCAEAHDGRVLAFAPGRAGCPAETDAVLAAGGDGSGTGDVLCVSEGP
jgi:hypothetical protein